jgi:hypothetical protein
MLNETILFKPTRPTRPQRKFTPRPLDQFAKHFITYATDWCYINYDIRLPVEEYLQTVKVYETTDRFWAWLLKVRKERMVDGSPSEYSCPQPQENIDGMSIPPVGKDRATGQMYYIPPEAREAWHLNMFPLNLAHEFAQYDGLVFIYKPDRWARKFLHEKMAPDTSEEVFQWAKSLTIAEAPYRVTAHECVHLLQKISGGTMPTWDPATDVDPAEQLFDQFLDEITLPAFVQLYLNRDGPLADKLDI